ncbi:bifunctional phosphatase PAP2/diacylglycerol kinase family protein [Williamsia sp. MIQD14]|uniref:bifunctional phosphatase PAP2/diacylglycerol kinase family protein n=1 Tax=Williamsia sp. MIQD14 TaxID=3425703 RepID=UPI003DA11278
MRTGHHRRRRRIGVALGAVDRAVYDAVARSDSPLLDATMPRLTNAANYSRLWFAIAAGLVASRSASAQRGAARGVTSLAVSSVVTNQIAKRVWSRRRPIPDAVPLARVVRTPSSTSMPSGHSASAAAFAVGVGLENRKFGAALAPLAALVGVSRVATGAHYPADVVVGFGMGASIALLIGRVFPPMSVYRPVDHAPRWVPTRERSDGAGVVLVINPNSGSGSGERIIDEIRAHLPAAEIVTCGEGDDTTELLRRAAERAEVLAVGGGDGTVAAAADIARTSGVPLAVFPAGTFNHFAKDIGCATVADTVAAIRKGRVARVDLALLNGETAFINNANIGAYPQFVRFRERYENTLGKPVASVYAMLHTLRRERPVRLRYRDTGNEDTTVTTSLFFLGTSVYETPGFAPAHRPRMDDGLLDVRILEVDKRFAKIRIMFSVLTGQLARSKLYHEMRVTDFTVTSLDGPTTIALDGEIRTRATTASFTVDHEGLAVFGSFERE